MGKPGFPIPLLQERFFLGELRPAHPRTGGGMGKPGFPIPLRGGGVGKPGFPTPLAEGVWSRETVMRKAHNAR